jgi:nicotinamidase-related amidase
VRESVENSVVGLAKSAKLFNVPVVLTTVAAQSFSGFLIQKLQDTFPGAAPIDRTSINSWEDANLKKAVEQTGKKKIIIAGLWTEACVLFPALCMMSEGYELFVVTDASAGASKAAHKSAISRMCQSGAHMVTWMQVCLEWQRDWSDKTTYQGVMDIMKEHGGAYGFGIEYAESMLSPEQQQAGKINRPNAPSA